MCQQRLRGEKGRIFAKGIEGEHWCQLVTNIQRGLSKYFCDDKENILNIK
jgi:hypothetical protein